MANEPDDEEIDGPAGNRISVGTVYSDDALADLLTRSRNEALEEAARIADEHERDMISLIDKGKGEHGKPGYVRDSTWDAWQGKRFAAAAIARAIRALKQKDPKP